MKPLWIIGSGGHAKVVIETARATGFWDVVGCLDDDPVRSGHRVLGVPIVGPISIETISANHINFATIAIGSNTARLKIGTSLDQALEWATLIHPHAYVAATAAIDPGTVVFAGAVVQPDVRIGCHVIVNTSASVDHDSVLGSFTHIAPGNHLAGGVTIGDGALLGIGSAVTPGCRIGEWTVVGAGTVVTHDLPANVTAVGAPAKVIKTREPGWHLV